MGILCTAPIGTRFQLAVVGIGQVALMTPVGKRSHRGTLTWGSPAVT